MTPTQCLECKKDVENKPGQKKRYCDEYCVQRMHKKLRKQNMGNRFNVSFVNKKEQK